MATTFAAISTDAPGVYVAREMYRLGERYLRIGKYASRYVLPQRFSKTIRIVRYKRLTLPVVPLTEGVPPSDSQLVTENVDVTLDQWGIVAFLTDVGLITTVHPALQIAIDRTALAIAETLEREMCRTLLGGTSVIFPGAVTVRGSLANTDVITTAVILTATTQLRVLGGAEFDGGLYAGVLSPQQEADVLKSDATFQTAHNYVNVKALEYGEIGIWMAVRWARGNFMPIYLQVGAPAVGAATATVGGLLTSIAGTAYTAGVTLSGGIQIVARDINSDFERKISTANTTFALTAGQGAFQVTTPTSANYTYDVYAPSTVAGSGTPVLAASRVAANTVVTISTLPVGVGPPTVPASGVTVYVAWVFAKDAFGRVELNGMSLQSYLTPPGASFSNPLAQGRKVGSKIMWKSFIIDNNFLVRIETGSAFASQLPA